MSEEKEIIIIAEDSAPNRKILGHLLQKLGYDVIACEDGAVAWAEYQKYQGKNIVAIISDIMMPNEDGIQFLRHIRQESKRQEIPFVLVTAVSEKEYIMQAKDLNVNGYILKPVSFQKVTKKLTELFPHKRFPKLAG